MSSDTPSHGPGAVATRSAPTGERGQRATAREQALPGAVARALDSLLGGAAPTTKARQMEGEFRYITVAFVDISGFTALSETMDPEDLRDLVNACLQPLSACIFRYGGSIDKYIGDCIMAVFGAPVAQEDDAERCVLACLDMMDVPTTLAAQRQVNLKLHTGINTGQVVAGAIGAARDAAYTMMGDTVNTASRLEGVATAGQILVADSTYRLTRHAIVYEPSLPVVVKGKRQPLTGHFAQRRRAVRASPRGFADRETPYIGRAAEQRVVRAALDRLRRGQGGLLEFSGEAGTGKSLLAAELQRAAALPPFQLEQQAVDWVEGRCLSFGEHIPFWLPIGVDPLLAPDRAD